MIADDDLGAFEQALSHVDALLALPRPGHAPGDRHDAVSGHDPWICGLGHGSLALWIRGQAQNAFEYNSRAQAIADERPGGEISQDSGSGLAASGCATTATTPTAGASGASR